VSAPDAASAPVAVGEDAPIFEVMSTLRAMRRLKPDPVPDELLERLVQAAVWAPSGGNRQAMEFVIVTDRALMARLAQLWGRSVDAYLGSIGRVTPGTQTERATRAAQYQREHFHETPALIVACYRKLPLDARTMFRMHRSLGPADALRQLARGPRVLVISEASSVYPGVQNLLLAARALGLGATLTTLHRGFEDALKSLLGIPPEVEVASIVPLGHPVDRFGPTRRKSVDEVTFLDRWGAPFSG
jgi:nitroreductase